MVATIANGNCQDGLLSESTDDQEQDQDVEDTWRSKRRPAETRVWPRRRACRGVLHACTLVLVFACVVATTTVMWLFIDVREQASFLRNQLDQGKVRVSVYKLSENLSPQLSKTYCEISIDVGVRIEKERVRDDS